MTWRRRKAVGSIVTYLYIQLMTRVFVKEMAKCDRTRKKVMEIVEESLKLLENGYL